MLLRLCLWLVLGCLGVACASDPPPPAAPPPPLPPAPPPEPELKPGLNHHQLRKVMKEKADPAVSGCYTVAYSGKDDGSGRLVVDFSVNPDGSVARAEVTESTLDNATFEDCVRKVYEGLTFPKAPGSTDAARPYTFTNAANANAEAAAASEK